MHDRPRQRTAGCPGRAERARIRRREQPSALQLADLRGAATGHHHEPVLRARRVDALRDHDRGAERHRRAAVRQRDRRPGRHLSRAAQLLRGAAAGGRAHLALPGTDHPAREAHDDRRPGRRHRVEQHGHALVQPRPRDLGDDQGQQVRAVAAARRGQLPGALPRTHAGRVDAAPCAARSSTTSRASPPPSSSRLTAAVVQRLPKAAL